MSERKGLSWIYWVSCLFVMVFPFTGNGQVVTSNTSSSTRGQHTNTPADILSKRPALVQTSDRTRTNERLEGDQTTNLRLRNVDTTAMLMVNKQPRDVEGPSVAHLTYSLNDCYQRTLLNNTTVRRAQNQISSNIIDRETAKFSLYPSLSYSLGHYLSFGKNIDPVTNSYVYETFSGGYTSVSLQLNIFSAFNRINTIKQTGFIIQSSEYAKKRLEIDLLANVTLLYARLLSDGEQLKTVRGNIQSTLAEIDIINEKIKVGRLTKYEYYPFSARLNSHKVDQVTLETDSMEALGELRFLMNMPFDQALELAPVDTGEIASLSATNISAREYVESILKSHPAIRQAQMDEQVAQMGVKIVKSNSWPTISIGGNISSNYNANQVNSNGDKISLSNQLNNNLGQYLNLGLKVPIFSQMQTANRIKKERINVENSRLAVTEAINTISKAALQSLNDFNSAREKYQASKLAWEQNNLTYDMYKEKYRLGQVSSVELIAISDILQASSLKFLQTKLELFLRYQLLQLLQTYSQQ